MAYATTNPPQCLSRGVSGPSTWIYVDGDAHTDVDAVGYFTNGNDLGMAVNDIVFVVDTATPTGTMHVVTVSTAGGAASISTATLA